MPQENRFALYALLLICFSGSYFLTEIIPVPLWWYYPLDQHWEFGLLTTPGLRMGWYGKVFTCLIFSLSLSGLGWLILSQTDRVIPVNARILIDLTALSVCVFTLYYIARSLSSLMV
jgi:hypothetical protein